MDGCAELCRPGEKNVFAPDEQVSGSLAGRHARYFSVRGCRGELRRRINGTGMQATEAREKDQG